VNKIRYFLLLLALSATSNVVSATNYLVNGLSISYIRVVGDYSEGTSYDNTIELHFSLIAWPEGSNCAGNRVYIHTDNTHMISAAYAAYISGLTVDINADDTLPMRGTNCELSYMDINRTQ
jgi:hypothetical protein